ncbi:NTP transferase domain-containing protein [Robertmurraya massiliosenegalensis]|uniref:NTP transferase domain-containing protein n=1 Tax=Robertmurraya TaxID=2837507 RepID=UPI0039A47F5F
MENNQRIVGIYLAAGSSRRMGRNKLTLPLGNSILGIHALHTALHTGINHIIIITSEKSELQWSKYLHNKLSVVTCEESKKGMSFSLKRGFSEAQKMNADGVMILLADQPFIQASMLNELIDTFSNEPVEYVASSYNNIIRPPLLIGKSIFPLVDQLSGDKGIKQVLMKHLQIKGKTIPFEDEMLFIDIDTREEYREMNDKLT